MAPTLQKTPKSYRSCILHEFQLGRSIDEAYKYFRENTKNANFYYVKFAYWFNRFANGKFDLDDESFDKKPLTFLDLPYDILGEIVGKLDTKSRFSARKVSRFLRNVVDNQPQYEEISIHFATNNICIRYETHRVIYEEHGDRCQIGGKVLNGDFVDNALNDLAIVLKNPKLQLKNFCLAFSLIPDMYKKKILKFFESLKSPIHVKSVTFCSGVQFVLPLLSMFKPGILKGIHLGAINTEIFANQLVMTEQWKQAKRFFNNLPMPIDIKEFFHFSRFNVRVPTISTDYVIFLRDTLSKCTNFESCQLSIFRSFISIPVMKEIVEKFGKGVVIPSHYVFEKINFHRYPIPGSNEFLEFSINSAELSIRRTN